MRFRGCVPNLEAWSGEASGLSGGEAGGGLLGGGNGGLFSSDDLIRQSGDRLRDPPQGQEIPERALEPTSRILATLALFVVLAVVMYLTRNLDWYNLSENVPWNERGDQGPLSRCQSDDVSRRRDSFR